MDAYITISGVSKRFGVNQVLKNISLEVSKGALVTLLGPSGCGKSTLLRAVAGLTHIDEGRVIIDGQDMTNVDARLRQVGMVFQSYALFPNLTARKNISFGLDIGKTPQREIERRVSRMIELTGLQGKEDARPAQLSGGQQQRVALARALVMEPKVLLLDEPLSALDAQIRQSLRAQIRQIQRQTGITALFVTHDQEEAMAVSDRICVMHDGVIEQQGAPEELYKRPQTEFVARFIGHYNVLTPAEAARVFHIQPPASKVVAIRPEAIDPGAASGDGLSFTARVESFAMLGSILRYRIETAGVTLTMEAVNHDRRALKPGEEIVLSVARRNLLEIPA